MIKAAPCPGAEQVKLGRRSFWSMGGNVIRFIEEYCVFTNARWTGEPFVLQPWQKKMIWELFEVNAKTGKRRFRRALIGLPRKQGKTELAAAIGLYLMLADGEKSAQLYCAAGNEEQADLVFEAAKRMCSIDGAPLAKMVKVEAKRLTSLADPYSYFERLSSKGATKHGLNPHGVIFDELHVWGVGQHEELWDALTTGSGARDQPLQIAITTADDRACTAFRGAEVLVLPPTFSEVSMPGEESRMPGLASVTHEEMLKRWAEYKHLSEEVAKPFVEAGLQFIKEAL